MEKRITGHTELLGLVATPIRHSKSPVMHNAACRALGLDYAYLAFDIQPDQLEDAVKGFKALNVRGWNVSMPYKTTIGQYLDHITPIAKMCGAINTVINDHGVLTGTITDGTGYMTALKDQGIDIIGKKMTIVGAGGAATAIVMQAVLNQGEELMQQTIPSYEPHRIIEDYLNEENHLAVISVDGGNFTSQFEKLPPITYSVELNPTRCQSNNFYFTRENAF